ncbi:MAG TPA: hypothetical protein VD793_03780, partial [Gemmatimonadales bacterium]|nr:hypothetical protein [Gemmatimonadales bacterium]
MIIAVPKERAPGEHRVALVPDAIKRLAGAGARVRVEQEAGAMAGYPDEAYRAAGAEVEADAASLWSGADVVVTVRAPAEADVSRLREGAALVGVLQPAANAALMQAL